MGVSACAPLQDPVGRGACAPLQLSKRSLCRGSIVSSGVRARFVRPVSSFPLRFSVFFSVAIIYIL